MDEIVPKLLLENAEVLSEPLFYIFRKSLDTGQVPTDWKRANVTAIYKKDDRELPCNEGLSSLVRIIRNRWQHAARDQHDC